MPPIQKQPAAHPELAQLQSDNLRDPTISSVVEFDDDPEGIFLRSSEPDECRVRLKHFDNAVPPLLGLAVAREQPSDGNRRRKWVVA